MARDVLIYVVVHQPRRLKLPAQPIPFGASAQDVERCLFDETLNERYFRKVVATCYRPATEMFMELVEEGLRLNVGLSFSFLHQALTWDPDLVDAFRRLVAHPNVELIGVEPYHGFILLLDLERFVERMRLAQDRLAKLFGRRPRVTDTTELCMSDPIYAALDRAGFAGSFIDGRPWVLGWRAPSFLYHGGGGLKLLVRHHRLSDDVGYRFSDRTWAGWPLMADTYASWLRQTSGDLVVLAWDYETFGEHHRQDAGIFDFIRQLPREARQRDLRFVTASEAIAAHGAASHRLALPVFPATWAGSGGMEFFLGNPAQQAVFQLMLHAYNKARLSGDGRMLDLALWLTQSDNLHLIQWYGSEGSEAEVSSYFTPEEWWRLGRDGIVREIQQVYKNFVGALDVSMPRGGPAGRGQPSRPDPEVAAFVRSVLRSGVHAPRRRPASVR